MMAIKNNTFHIFEHSNLRNVGDKKISRAKRRAEIFIESESFEKYLSGLEDEVSFTLGIYTQKVNVISLKVKKTKKGKLKYWLISECINEADYIIYESEWQKYEKGDNK
ncbi:hypothetical protein [Methanococcus sp. CF]